MAQHSCKNGIKGCIVCGVRDNLKLRYELLLKEEEMINNILKIYEDKEWLFKETDKFLYKRHTKEL